MRAVRPAVLLLLLLAATSCTQQREEQSGARPGPSPSLATAEQRNPSGALAAAGRHLRLLNGPEMYDRSRRAELLERATAPEFRDDLPTVMDGYDRAGRLLGLAGDGSSPDGAVVARTGVLGAEVTDWQGDRATVSLWTVGVLGVAGPASAHPVQERWSTEDLDLVWHDGRWLWAGLSHHEGPVPVAGAQLPSPAEALDDLPRPEAPR